MKKRILLIDDEEDIREVAQLSLELEGGWDVLTAGSGREGVAIAAAEQPDAILLDMMMPMMDGFTTLKKLQSHPDTRSLPVIFLTAKTYPDDENEFTQLGVKGTISKPFDPTSLVRQIVQLLDW